MNTHIKNLRLICAGIILVILTALLGPSPYALAGVAASGDYLWHTYWGGSSDDYAKSITVDAQGNIYLAGTSRASWQGVDNGGNPVDPKHAFSGTDKTDLLIVKLDPDGNYLWHTFWGSAASDYTTSIIVDPSGFVYVAGSSLDTWQGVGGGNPINPKHAFSGTRDIVLLKLTGAGDYVWHTFWGGAESDTALAVAMNTAGEIFLGGYSYATWQGMQPGGSLVDPIHAYTDFSDIFALKLNSSGEYQWHTFWGGASYDENYSIALDNSGGVYLAGRSGSGWQGVDSGGNPVAPLHGYTSGNYDFAVLKLNSSGNYQWHTFWGSAALDQVNSIAVDSTGSVYVAGESDSSWLGADGDGNPVNPRHAYAMYGTGELTLLKLNSSGSYQWHTFWGGYGPDGARAVAVDALGDVYLAGYTSILWQGVDGSGSPVDPIHPMGGSYDIVAVKLTGSGVYLWHTFWGSSDDSDYPIGIVLDNQNGLYILGGGDTAWQGEDGAGNPVNPKHAHSGLLYDILVLKLDASLRAQDTTTGVASSLNPSVYGQSVTFTAAVTAAIGVPTGSVQFEVDGVNLGAPVALSGGTASLTSSNLSVGTHAITAQYSGDAAYNASTGALPDGQVVEPLPNDLIVANVLHAFSQEVITYTITVSRQGDEPANGVVISDTIPAGISAFDWTCQASGGAVCANASSSGSLNETITAFPAGGVLIYTVRAARAAFTGSPVLNIAEVLLPIGIEDVIPGNNRAQMAFYQLMLPGIFR